MKEICQLCKKNLINDSDTYEYRGFLFHEACFDEGCEKVDYKRNEVREVTEHSIQSQANGEWANGGYKTMKTDPHTGRPIPTKITIPQILTDYESGIL